jgi:MATE family multidrug resistance protein
MEDTTIDKKEEPITRQPQQSDTEPNDCLAQKIDPVHTQESQELDTKENYDSALPVDGQGDDDDNRDILSYRQHLLDVSKITGFIIASEIFQNTLPVIDIAFIGRLPDGKDDLAAAALATVWFNLWNSTMIGFLSAIDTLLAQSYGANEMAAFRAWAGTSLVIVLLVTILVAGMLALCGPAMKLVGQDPALADEAAAFSYRLIPGLFPYYIFKVMIKVLQTQDILWPGIVIGIFANGFNILLNWLLIYALDMGIAGAPWATTITRFVECFMLIGYFLHKRSTLQSTWPVFSTANMATESLRPFWKLSISGALSMTAEAWSFEITTILAGLLGTTELDAHIITLTIATFIFLSFPFAVGIAASIRVGQLVGDGSAADARRSGIISLVLSVCIQAVLVGILLPCNELLGQLFSSDPDVAELVAFLIPISCVFMMGDAAQATIGGVLRGLGRQKLVLFLNILGFWVLAVPLGSILTFVVDLGVVGLWWGMVIGIYSSSFIGILFLKFRVDWKLETRKALKRVSTLSTAHGKSTLKYQVEDGAVSEMVADSADVQ